MYNCNLGCKAQAHFHCVCKSFFFQMAKSVLEEVCLEVILSDGDAAHLTLSLTCTALRDVVSSLEFRHRAHYAWLENKFLINFSFLYWP